MELWISDSSPLFIYSPSPGFFANTPWQAAWTGVTYTSAATNNTFHETTAPSSVILSNITSSGITPIWNATPGYYNVALQVDGSSSTDWTSGQTLTTTQGSHAYQLNLNCMQGSCSDKPFQLLGFYVQTAVDSSSVNVTLDDSSQWVTYNGFTSYSNSTPDGISVQSSDYDQTLSMTTTSGATAQVNFEGTAILVNGVTAASLGTFAVTLDGSLIATLTANNNVTAHGVPLFFTSGLSTNYTHSLKITAESGSAKVGLVIDSWTVFGSSGQTSFIGTSGSTTTTITSSPMITGSGSSGTSSIISSGATGSGSPSIGTILGAIIGTFGALGILYYLMRRAATPPSKKAEKKLNPWDEANLLQNMKNEEVYVTTAAKDQRYVYPGLIAHSQLK